MAQSDSYRIVPGLGVDVWVGVDGLDVGVGVDGLGVGIGVDGLEIGVDIDRVDSKVGVDGISSVFGSTAEGLGDSAILVADGVVATMVDITVAVGFDVESLFRPNLCSLQSIIWAKFAKKPIRATNPVIIPPNLNRPLTELSIMYMGLIECYKRVS